MAQKFGTLSDNFVGKRIVLIDDSIVRGNTISPIIKVLKEAGAKEVKDALGDVTFFFNVVPVILLKNMKLQK